jgi:hypothetical protein
MSDLTPTDLPAVALPDPAAEPAPVVFPSDGTAYAAPQTDAGAAVAPVEAAPLTDAPVAPSVAPAPVSGDVVAPEGGQLITLPSGYKVALRSTRSVRARDRKNLFAGVDFENASGDVMATGMTVLANVEKLLITAWDVRDYDDATGAPKGDVLPIPSATTDDVLGGLSIEDANALDEAGAEAQKVLLPNFAPSPDAASPTQPSAG